MRQRYLRLISVLLLLAILTACGTDREGAAGGTVEGVVNRNGDFLVLLTDEGEYQAFEFEGPAGSLDCRRGICLRAEPGPFCAMLEKQEGAVSFP